ncbi:MAG: hypothetical protein GY830_08295 [Bacteroidetes bacterium]|nr:hypothetical protein [Bacteroidota bacterium]
MKNIFFIGINLPMFFSCIISKEKSARCAKTIKVETEIPILNTITKSQSLPLLSSYHYQKRADNRKKRNLFTEFSDNNPQKRRKISNSDSILNSITPTSYEITRNKEKIEQNIPLISPTININKKSHEYSNSRIFTFSNYKEKSSKISSFKIKKSSRVDSFTDNINFQKESIEANKIKYEKTDIDHRNEKQFNNLNNSNLNLLQTILAKFLDIEKSSICLKKCFKSYTNYVCRINLKEYDNIVIKYSTNKSRKNGAKLDPCHLSLEYQVLQLDLERNIQNIKLPTPLFFDNQNNIIFMTDLGNSENLYDIDYKIYEKSLNLFNIGKFLQKVHNYNFYFKTLLKASEIKECIYKYKLSKLLTIINWDITTPIKNPIKPGPTLLDFSPGNCLALENDIGIIDFDFISWSDQLFDIAHFHASFFMLLLSQNIKNKIYLDNFLIGYFDKISNLENNHKYWKRFCKYYAATMCHRISQHVNLNYIKEQKSNIEQIFSCKINTWNALYFFIIHNFDLHQ